MYKQIAFILVAIHLSQGTAKPKNNEELDLNSDGEDDVICKKLVE